MIDFNLIPERTKVAIDRYVKDRCPTGDFLYAVLSNRTHRPTLSRFRNCESTKLPRPFFPTTHSAPDHGNHETRSHRKKRLICPSNKDKLRGIYPWIKDK